MSKGARHTDSSFFDQEAVTTIQQIFSRHRLVAGEIKQNDKGPNHDGILEVLNPLQIEIGKIVVQVKGRLIKDASPLSCGLEDNFLDYCSITRENPIILILVPRGKNLAYWQEMNPDIVKDMRKRKTKTIHFDKKNLISEERTEYHYHWKKMCEERQKAIEKYLNQSINSPNKAHDDEDFEKAKIELKNLFVSEDLKYKYYYAFIDLIEPFYLGERGNEKRGKLRGLFEISEEIEGEFLEKMKKDALITFIGDLCIVNRHDKAKSILEEIINKDLLNLELVIKIFN